MPTLRVWITIKRSA